MFGASVVLATGENALSQGVPGLSHYGAPGYIEMPSGFALPDGTLALSFNAADVGMRRGAVTFQFSPRIQGTFRYSYLKDYFTYNDGSRESLYDRSFDIRFQLLREAPEGWTPAVSIGMQDFGGTGVFGSEYIAASKHLGEAFTATLGLGWGRYGTYGGFDNPLAIFSDRFKTRPGFAGIQDTGQVAFDRFFHGDAAVFAAADWRPTDQWRFTLEYSSDAMTTEVNRLDYDFRTPFNLGAEYQFEDGGALGVSLLSGSTLAFRASFVLNPKDPPSPSGREPGPPAISPGSADPVAAWSPRPDPAHEARLRAALRDQGVTLKGIAVSGDTAVVAIENARGPAAAQAQGRAAAVLSAQLPPAIGTFRLRDHVKGMPVTEVTIRRADLAELEYAFDGAWQSYARAGIGDAALSPDPGGWGPSAQAWLGPYLTPFLFDPDNPLRVDFGVEAGGSWSPWQGTYLSGAFRQKIMGNLDQATRVSDSTLPHVRSDAALYAKADGVTIPYLTAAHFTRLGQDLYGQVSAGLLEPMFGGVFGEVLWAPPGQALALGGDLAYARQRDFEGRFGFQDYDVVTGFLSGYYDFGGGYLGRIDVGRYLAKDWGSTFTVNRRFNNGFQVGAFFTLTDVGFDEFGEGSFDKGITFSVPFSWVLGKPERDTLDLVIRPILRDGGAQLWNGDRLYDLTRPARQNELGARWERFWR